jgi:DNA-binding CsgD family transcriptional regulator
MPEQPVETETRSRQEQILMLASEGLTDKEIAAKLRLSPETVGTYWRRILSKYAAASRTEVVAKVVRLQAEVEVGHLTQVSEGLREVADHLLVVLREQRPEVQDHDHRGAEAIEILAGLPDLIVAVDSEGFTTYSNGTVGSGVDVGEPIEWSLEANEREPFREALARVLGGGEPEGREVMLTSQTGGADRYDAVIIRRDSGGAILALRPK